MKKTTIIKASLASIILGTGLYSSTAQASELSITRHLLGLDKQTQQAPQTQNVQKADREDTNVLYNYYMSPSFEWKDITGYTEEGNKLSFTPPRAGLTLVTLSPDAFKKYNTSNEGNSGLDVFVVRENTDRGTTDSSIGGVTQTNKYSYKDTLKNVPIQVKTTDNGFNLEESITPLDLNKEEVSLKELDFKLRKQLITNKGLYKTYTDGEIKVHLNNGGVNTFELRKRLQDNRMSDVIKSSDIKHVQVTLTK